MISVWQNLSQVLWFIVSARLVLAGIACLSNPCLHGICIDDINSTYSCYCVDGYTGVQCQTNWDECWSNPCHNGGSCNDGIASYNCTCLEGFLGDNCEINYDECESNPCMNNGTCIDMTNGYICSCIPGFSGQHCEVDIAVCNSTEEIRCYNGGQCLEGPGYKFYCKCLPGWGGKRCEHQIDECESSPCQNGGACIDLHADYMCACNYGHTGKSCEIRIQFCESSPCENNALCLVEEDLAVCYCVPDFHGERCQMQYDECLLGPGCKNGGTCIDGIDSFSCSCPPQLTGSLCECLILEDGIHDCTYNISTQFPNTISMMTTKKDLPTTESYSTTKETTVKYLTTTPSYSVDNHTISTTSVIVEGKEITDFMEITQGNTTFVNDFTTKIETTTQPIELTTVKEVTLESVDSKADTTTEKCQGARDNETGTTSQFLTTAAETTTTEIISTRSATTTELTSTTKHKAIEPLFTVMTSMTPVTTTTRKVTTEKVIIATEMISPDITTDSITTEIIVTTNEATTNTTERDDHVSTVISYTEDFTTKMPIPDEITTELSTTEKGMTEMQDLTTVTFATTTEVLTTAKHDTTTDKIFTDSPTEPSIDVTTSIGHADTESTEVSTGDDEISYTTAQSECSDSICNDKGKCINTLQGVRCQCKFKYGGRYCEEEIKMTTAAFNGHSYIAHRLENTTSINIGLNANTLMQDGQILYVDIAKGVYVQLYMYGGLLRFKFSCGYQTMLLSELKNFVNNGYTMKLDIRLDIFLPTQHCNATLTLNETLAMSGGQTASVVHLDHKVTLYLGNSPKKDVDYKPFVGCIQDLNVNGAPRQIFSDAFAAADVTECSSLVCLSNPCLNGGSCLQKAGGYACSCSNGWTGSQCSQSVCLHNPCEAGGSCVSHAGSGFLCLCAYGRHGIFCEYNVEIIRPSLSPISAGVSSYVIYPLALNAINSDRFDLRLKFHTQDMDQIALLAFVGQNGRHDSKSPHLAVTFVKGYIMVTWNMGGGARRIFTQRAVSGRRGGHTLRVWRRGRSATLIVDGRYNVTGNAPQYTDAMSLSPYLYIGGHPSQDFYELPHDLPLHSGFHGCIWEVGGQAVGPGRPIGGRGVGQCGVTQCTAKSCHAPNGICVQSPASYGCICNEGYFGATCTQRHDPLTTMQVRCRGQTVITMDGAQCDCSYGKTGVYCDQDLQPSDIMFSGVRSYLRLRPLLISSVSLAIEVEIKPNKERGLVFFAQTPNFYTALSLQGGLLEFRWADVASGVTSIVRSSVVLPTRQLHTVRAGRYGSRLYVWADGALSTEPMLAHTQPHTAGNVSVLIGGAEDLSTLPFNVMNGPVESFAGCVTNLHLNNVIILLEKQNIQDGRNVFDCDGTLCGREMCAGRPCVIEGGVPRCACDVDTNAAGTDGTNFGARCRRGGQCGPRCASCRHGRCVCPAGYQGEHCDRSINVTVPQFNGDSLLSVNRRPQKQRLAGIASTIPQLQFITLNFTTPEDAGLLLWMSLDNEDYIGIGIKNGFVQLSYSIQSQLSNELQSPSTKPKRNITKLLPNPGYVSDGEWHILTLRIRENKLTLEVDAVMAYLDDFRVKPYDQVEILIGGVPEDMKIAKQKFPKNFKGCIDHLATEEHSYITDYTSAYSENVQSCQLIPSM